MKLLLAFAVLIAALIPSRAQPAARLVDSYNDKIHSSEAEQWRLEDFMKLLDAEPNSKAYIIAYAGREDHPGKSLRYTLRAKNYLVEWRGISPERIVSIDGGRREEFVVELWLVPNTTRPPKPNATIAVPDDHGDNLLYDDFDTGYDNFGNKTQDAASRLDGYAAALKNDRTVWGCIVAYAEAGDDRTGMDWDPPGTAQKLARAQKRYLVAKHHIAPSKLSVIDGGYGRRGVELWIMRPNARFDNGPFLYSTRLKAKGNGTLALGKQDRKGMCCKACARGRTNPYLLKYVHQRRPLTKPPNRTNRWTRAGS
jgi:hypothetical protein